MAIQNINNPLDIKPDVATQTLADQGYIPVSDTFKISSTNLTPTPEVPYNTPAETPVYPVAKLDTTTPTLGAEQQKEQDINTQTQDLIKSLLGESAYKTGQETAQGLPELQKTQTDLTAQLKAIQNEAAAIPLQLQQDATGRGITAGGLAPIQASRLRANAIQALTTSSLLEASRGNLATAQTMVDRAVAQKFDPIKEQITANKSNLELIIKSPAYTEEQKTRAQAQLDIQVKNKTALDKQAEDAKTILNTATEAAKNGADALTLQKISNAKTPLDAVMASGEFLGANKETKTLMAKYPDAGILPTDTIEQAQAKLVNSAIYKNAIGGGNKEANTLIGKGYVYIETPAELTKLRNQGRTIQSVGGKLFVAPTKTVKTVKGGYDIVDSVSNKKIGGEAPIVTTTTKKVVVKNVLEDKVNTLLAGVKGTDNKVSPQDWNLIKDAYIKDGGTATNFDTKFKGYKNTKNKNY